MAGNGYWKRDAEDRINDWTEEWTIEVRFIKRHPTGLVDKMGVGGLLYAPFPAYPPPTS